MYYLLARCQDWFPLKTNLLWIHEGEVSNADRRLRIDPASDPLVGACVAWLLLAGRASIRCVDGWKKIKAGDWVVPSPGLGDQEFSKEARVLSMCFQIHWLDERALFEHQDSLFFRGAEFPEMEEAARMLMDMMKSRLAKAGSVGFSLRDVPVESLIDIRIGTLQFARGFVRALSSFGLGPTRLGIHDKRVVEALSSLDKRPLKSKFSGRELASEVGLGLSQLVRLFRAEVGLTPKKYLELRRKEACKRLLIYSALPLKEVSFELGFRHHSDFSHWFRKFYKVSPKSFRYGSAATRICRGGRSVISCRQSVCA